MSKYLSQLHPFKRTDILGWSLSRYATFQSCKRMYYYNYYPKFDFGNTNNIYQLKDLTTIPLEIGEISHDLIRALLIRLQKSAEKIDLERFFNYAHRVTISTCQKRAFEDIYYKKRDSIDFEAEIYSQVEKAMENFLKSDRLQWLFEEALVSKDDWIVELSGGHEYGECRIDGMKAFCKVDFMFPIDGGLHIIDWKTGKVDYNKHSSQLKGYAGWANFQFGVDISKIQTTVAYLLPEYNELSISVNDYDMDDFVQQVRSQTNEMYEYLQVRDSNFPKPKEEFPMTPIENFCKTCKFRELCDRV